MPTSIPLPVRTRAILEKKVANRATLQALLDAENQAINDLVAAAGEMLGVPEGWVMRNTDAGFTAPAAAPLPGTDSEG